MSRIRTIQPNFPKSRSMGRVSRDARLLFIQLWLIADDTGRLRFDHQTLVEDLYPEDPDASTFLAAWLDELEREKCIERYQVNDLAFVRIVKWRKHQIVDRPSASTCPPAPREAREPREPREESPPMQKPRASKANAREEAFFLESVELPGTPGEFPPQRVLDILEIALRKSISTEAQTATARYVELAGRKAGLWGGHSAPVGKKGSAERSLSPAELMGPPVQQRPVK
jgi:hypothetical protein